MGTFSYPGRGSQQKPAPPLLTGRQRLPCRTRGDLAGRKDTMKRHLFDGHAPASLEVEVQTSADRLLLAVAGDLDLATADQLVDLVDRTCDAPPPRVLIDLGERTFLDVVGLRGLERVAALVSARGSALSLAGLQALQRNLIDLLDLAPTFGLKGHGGAASAG